MTANTLTDRYVREVARRVPAGQRDDIATELRATIADTVEARDAEPGAAEREVLTEMGDPVRLAARYADRPLALIGPDLYPAYTRLLVTLLTTALPAVTAVAVGFDVLDGKDAGSLVGTAVGTVLTVGAQMIAWVTAGFALVERSRHRDRALAATRAWTPDDLPAAPRNDRRDIAACASAAWHALLLGLIVWQHTAEPYRADGRRLQVLDPDLWTGWIWPVLAGLAGLAALDLARFATRERPLALAAWYAAAQAAFTLPLAWILYRHMFFDPDFLAHVNGGWKTPTPSTPARP
ncbi:hypothetical protein ACFQHO_04040 [Actinomadura yumaensis]|uniref:HAAS signaling domain-containing protein n=1 Tax=Actinomadura yumaensis TaxID=111807 RepID=UPI003614C902